MRNGVFQRTVVAIVLMVSFLVPSGICLQPAHKAAHSCCLRASKSHQSVGTNCCTASAPLPAVIAASSLPTSSSMTAAPGIPFTPCFLFTERSTARDSEASALSACGRIHLKNLNLTSALAFHGVHVCALAFFLLPIHAELKSEIHLSLCAVCGGAFDSLFRAVGATLRSRAISRC